MLWIPIQVPQDRFEMNSFSVHRRHLNRLALALALTPWLGACAQAQPGQGSASAGGARWQTDPFGLGVASGQPQPDSVVLWTRLRIAPADEAQRGRAQSVLCEVFADEALRQPVRRWLVQTDASRAHSVHVLANGLQHQQGFRREPVAWGLHGCGLIVEMV
jgi:alkaline phosphatase D